MSSVTKKKQYEISFPNKDHHPINLEEGSNLSQHLTITNSPILFGCRTGICGTCLSEILEVSAGELTPPTEDESDLLNVLAPSNPNARLACQIQLTASITIAPLAEE